MKTVEAADGKVSVYKLGKHLIFYQTYKSAPFFVQFIKSLHSNNLAPFLRHPSRGQVRWERRVLLQLLQAIQLGANARKVRAHVGDSAMASIGAIYSKVSINLAQDPYSH